MTLEAVPSEPSFLALESRKHPEQIVHQLLDAAPDAVVVVDARGRIVFANQQTERVFGHTRSELVGQLVEVLIPERFRAGHVAARGRFAAAPHARPMGSGLELLGRARDGRQFPIEISLSPVETDEGTLVCASIRDVSVRKQEEAIVRRSQDLLSSAIESVKDAFAIFDARDQLVLCNSSYRQLLGDQLHGNVAGRAFGEVLKAMCDALCARGEGDGATATRWAAYHAAPQGSLDVRARDGQRLRVTDRRTAEGGTVTTIVDVTDDVQHEEELRQARAAAEAASSAKSEFLASMSHELRTPLNAILGFAQLLSRDRKNPLSDRQLERIEHVLRGGEHLLRLIDDVLDLARIESGRTLVSPERVGLAEVLSEVKSTLDPLAARAGQQIILEPVPEAAADVTADRTRLKQILMNYGSNAIKYGRPQGSMKFRASARGGFVHIEVQDDGVGIARDKQAVLFQPFQRAGQEAGPIEGTGIGLAISKRLAELMGGKVGFESIEGTGSTFWLELPRPTTLPAPQPSALSVSPSESPLGAVGGLRYCIVYIEDNPSNIAFMRDLLADFENVELVTAANAELGTELVRAHGPDVVIMDVNLPGMSGIEASKLLKSWPETRHIPIIALSAAAMIRDAARVVGAGFYKYLTKPVQVDELQRTLEELLVERPAP